MLLSFENVLGMRIALVLASVLKSVSASVLALAAVLLCSTAVAQAAGSSPKVRLSTSAGDIVLQLDHEHAPKTVDNFLAYVNSGQYDGTVFHRVIDGFMIQGGGFTGGMVEKPTRPPIPLETKGGLLNARGTVAMARTSDPNSATAQFFINVADNARLDPASARDGFGYAVFGKVVAGMDVVDKIKAVATGNKGEHQNVPLDPITITKARVEQ